MRTAFTVISGGVLTVGLVLLALWGWQQAGLLADLWGATRPGVAALAVRSAAVAAAAAAQIILLTLVVGRFYPRQTLDEVLRLSAGLVATVALVSTIALALAGR